MEPRERILTLLRGGVPDRLPFAAFDRHLLQGAKEREARNRGLGLLCYRPCCIESISDVDVVTRSEGNLMIRTYNTPVGSATEALRVGVGYGQAVLGRDWQGVIPRRKEFLVKKPEDYKVLKFIAENLHYKPYYWAIEDQIKRLGDDGIVIATLPYSPLQRMLIELVEWTRFYTDLARNREPIQEIFEILEKRYEDELFPIAAGSPSEVIGYGDNIDSILVSPPLFEKYYLPTYGKCAEILHAKGKLLNVHMDGRLKALAGLIEKSRVDIVEAFTPPPTGDLPINEALLLWKNKIIWINFPQSISTLVGTTPDKVKKYLIEQLELMIPGERVLLVLSTEHRVPDESMMAMLEVIEKASLPLSKKTIESIRSS